MSQQKHAHAVVQSDANFSREKRLLTANDYRAVFRAPDYKSGQNEILFLARRNDRNTHRLGLAIAKKHVPTAVARNVIKRLLREYFRTKIAAQNTDSPQNNPDSPRAPAVYLDIIALTRPAARNAQSHEMISAVDRQFRRLLNRAQAESKPMAHAEPQ